MWVAWSPAAAEISFDWYDTYGFVEPRPDYGRGVAIDRDGNILATGLSTVATANADYITLKYAPDGTRLWERRYNGTGDFNDEGLDVGVDAAGNVYVGGISWGGGDFGHGPKYDTVVLKYDPDGNLVWEHRYNSIWDNDDLFTEMAVMPDGSVYAVGYSYGPIGQTPTAEYFTLRITPDGQLAWYRNWNGPEDTIDFLFAAVAADATGVVLGAAVEIAVPDGGHGVFGAIRYDTAGNERWSNIWSPPPPAVAGLDFTELNDVTIDAAGDVIVAGRYNVDEPTGDTEGDAGLVKFAGDDGQVVWSVVNSTLETDTFQRVTTDLDGNVFATGAYNVDTGFEFHANHLTAAYSSDGMFLWEHRFAGDAPNYDGDGIAAVDPAGRLVVATRNIMSATGEDMRVFVYDRLAGTVLETASFDAGCCDWIKDMALGPQGRLALVGHVRPDGSNAELAVVGGSLGGTGTPGPVSALTLALDGANLELTWTPSCAGGATDFAVYEGTLGDFDDHQPLMCSTSGMTAVSVTPSAGGRYYLVTSLDDDSEGSYGETPGSSERPAAAAACRPVQDLGVCP